jgi:uncharacterized protein (DUF1330 family)
VRGNDVQALEGTWHHERMVVVEFPDKAAAQSAETVILIAEGVPQ